MITIKQAKKTGFYGIVLGQRIKFVVSAAGHVYPEGRARRGYRIVAFAKNEQLVSDVIAHYNHIITEHGANRPLITLSESI